MSLQKILQAREERTASRLCFAEEGLASISLSFNIPGSKKSNKSIRKAFDYAIIKLNDFLLANRILTSKKNSQQLTDAAGDFYIIPIIETQKSIDEVKACCERYEEKHPLGRIIDVDLFSASARPISSGKLKKCFICDEPAMVCMQNQKHHLEELSHFVSERINGFLQSEILKETQIRLSTLATQCLLYEISLSPKPGLVDRFGNGAHEDMDYFSFINSTSSLSAYWSKLVNLASDAFLEKKIDETEELRQIGIAMERSMLQVTDGVNTQKGAIFLIGMLVYASAKLLFKEQELSDKNIRNELVFLNKENLNDELLNTKNAVSHGQKIFKKYGNRIGGGIRKELTFGLPIVFEHALPLLRTAAEKSAFMKTEKTAQPILKDCLLKIISINNDSNILYRSNTDILNELKKMADDCLKNSSDFDIYYKKLCEFCIDKSISPGGSADLLAASIFIFQLQNIN